MEWRLLVSVFLSCVVLVWSLELRVWSLKFEWIYDLAYEITESLNYRITESLTPRLFIF